MSQRRSGGIGNTIATVQQSIDNGLFADSPALQQTLQSRNTLPFTSSRTTSGLLSSPPSALLSGSSTSPVSAILSRQRTQTPFVRGSGLTSGLSPEQGSIYASNMAYEWVRGFGFFFCKKGVWFANPLCLLLIVFSSDYRYVWYGALQWISRHFLLCASHQLTPKDTVPREQDRRQAPNDNF